MTQQVGLGLLALRSPAADEVSVHCVGYLPFAVMNYYQLNDFSQQDPPEQFQAGRGSEQWTAQQALRRTLFVVFCTGLFSPRAVATRLQAC